MVIITIGVDLSLDVPLYQPPAGECVELPAEVLPKRWRGGLLPGHRLAWSQRIVELVLNAVQPPTCPPASGPTCLEARRPCGASHRRPAPPPPSPAPSWRPPTPPRRPGSAITFSQQCVPLTNSRGGGALLLFWTYKLRQSKSPSYFQSNFIVFDLSENYQHS